MTVEIPMRVPSAANLREHWAARAKRVARQRRLVGEAILCSIEARERWPRGARVATGTVVRLTRVSPRQLDGDNLQNSLKGVRDEVVRWLGVDDADPRVAWEYGQTTDGRPRYQGVRIEVLPSGRQEAG